MFLTGTFQCAVIAAKEDRDGGYFVVCRALTADESRQKDLGPPGVIARQPPVHNVALPGDKKYGLNTMKMTVNMQITITNLILHL